MADLIQEILNKIDEIGSKIPKQPVLDHTTLGTDPYAQEGYQITAGDVLDPVDQVRESVYSNNIKRTAVPYSKDEKTAASLNNFQTQLDNLPSSLKGLAYKTIPDELRVNRFDGKLPTIKAYRADAEGKYGGKDGMETLPIKLDKADIYGKVRALASIDPSKELPILPETLAALLLKEGRSDFGVNPIAKQTPDRVKPQEVWYDPNVKGEKETFDKLRATGMDEEGAGFIIRLGNKIKTAARLNIPFAEAWNGTGKTEEYLHPIYANKMHSHTGKEYADSFSAFETAVSHPKNAPLMDLIKQAIQDGIKYPMHGVKK